MFFPRLALGSLVSGYRLMAVLGEGGTGRVYEAIQEVTGRAVAIKVLGFVDMDRHFVEEVRRRFEQEASLLHTLDHPHLVRVTDSGTVEWDGFAFPWLCMDLAYGGRPFSQVYREQPNLAWLLDRVEEILGTLVYLHDIGVVHRDIKPDNVVIDEDGRLFIIDFGIARWIHADKARLTRTGQTLGTLQYMALEQIGGAQSVDGRADLYSVGMMMFEMLEEVSNWHDYLTEILCAQGVRLTQPVPAFVAEFVQTLAAPRREDRYPGAEDALAVLHAGRELQDRTC